MTLVPDKKIEFSVPSDQQDNIRNGIMPKCLLITRMVISNPEANTRLAFKLKTNNPTSYKVQPTQGIVAAN